MNLDQLRTFVIAADTLNFTRAAEILHLTQPAVSQQIKELESFFRAPLFERRGRQVQLAVGGEKLRPYARRLLSQVDEARSLLSELRGTTHGKLVLGSGNTIGTYLLPGLMSDFQRQHPEIQLSLKVTDSAELIELISHGELDLAVLEESPSESRLRQLIRVPLLKDELVLVGPSEQTTAQMQLPKGPLALQDLPHAPLLMRQMSSHTRQLIYRTLREEGLDTDQLQVKLELGNTEAIKQAAIGGLGLGWVSALAVQRELAAGLLRVIPVQGLTIERQLWLVGQQSQYLPERVHRFRAFLIEQAAS